MKARLISVILLLVAGAAVVVSLLQTTVSQQNEYSTLLATARDKAANDIPYVSVQNYKKAIDMKPEDEAVYKEYMEEAKILGDSFYTQALKEYVELFPMSSNAYEVICQYYYDSESYTKAIDYALEARSKGVATDKIKQIYLDCYYMYRYIATGYEAAGSFLGDVALVKKEGNVGYLNADKTFLLAPSYEDAAPYLNGGASVKVDGQWVVVNNEGYVVARPQGEVDSLSFKSSDKVRISKDNKYGYTDTSLVIPKTLEYDYASNYKNSVAAVCKDSQWSLIDTDGNKIIDETFEDIKLDEFDVCIQNGVIFAKKNNKYYMLDASGQKISDMGFDDVCPFVSEQPAAVCVNGKWGFVDAQGNMVIEPTYENAKSFCVDLAPVYEKGFWGYINQNGEMRISAQFSDCKSFSANAIAAVEESGIWNYIRLIYYCD